MKPIESFAHLYWWKYSMTELSLQIYCNCRLFPKDSQFKWTHAVNITWFSYKFHYTLIIYSIRMPMEYCNTSWSSNFRNRLTGPPYSRYLPLLLCSQLKAKMFWYVELAFEWDTFSTYILNYSFNFLASENPKLLKGKWVEWYINRNGTQFSS